MRRVTAALAAFVLLVAIAAGCRESDGGAHETPAAAEVGPDPAAGEASAERSPAAVPFPSLPGEGAPRTFALRLVNLREVGAVVYASAAAERVVVDTVPALDSVVVNLRLRADWVELHAVGPDGEELAAGRLDLDPDSVSRWTIPAESGAVPTGRTAASDRARSLVRVRDRDYARASSRARTATARAPTRGWSPRD